MGFNALARITLLRALQMRYGHSTRRAPRLRASASETRLMRLIETGSSQDQSLFTGCAEVAIQEHDGLLPG